MPAGKNFKPTSRYKTVEDFSLLARRSYCVVLPVQQQSRATNFLGTFPQIFVYDKFIALFHHGRELFILLAPKVLFGKFGEELFYPPIRIYPPDILQRTRFYYSRTATDYKLFRELSALRKQFESHPGTEGVRDNIRAVKL